VKEGREASYLAKKRTLSGKNLERRIERWQSRKKKRRGNGPSLVGDPGKGVKEKASEKVNDEDHREDEKKSRETSYFLSTSLEKLRDSYPGKGKESILCGRGKSSG